MKLDMYTTLAEGDLLLNIPPPYHTGKGLCDVFVVVEITPEVVTMEKVFTGAETTLFMSGTVTTPTDTIQDEFEFVVRSRGISGDTPFVIPWSDVGDIRSRFTKRRYG